jgi:hypothetical protein
MVVAQPADGPGGAGRTGHAGTGTMVFWLFGHVKMSVVERMIEAWPRT